MDTYAVVIIGGAATGSATAHHILRLDPRLDVAVVEREPTYEHCSTLRSDGNLRFQFNLEENIRMSQYAFELLDTFSDDMAIDDWRPQLAPKHQGNLFLTDEVNRAAALEGLGRQQSLGCDVEWLDADEIRSRWPQLGLVDGDVVGGTYGPRDGAIDPNALLQGFRRNAMRLGADYLADAVTTIVRDGDRIAGVEVAGGERVDAAHVVVAAGAWSTSLLATAGIDLPVEPVMRTVHVVEHDAELGEVPSVFLPNGLYALPESPTSSQMAWSTEDDPVGFDFTYRRASFESLVWPELVGTLAGYDRLKLRSGWCGLYAMNMLDQNAILGAWPGVEGLHVACGYSGHGFQHTPAMGRYLAERLTDAPVTLDLSRFSPQRVVDGVPLREHAGRII